MRSRFFLIVISLLFSGNYVYGQTKLSGQVLSLGDSLPVTGASVYFDGTSIGVSTRDDGTFQIVANSAITSVLIIQALGYKTVFVPNPGDSRDLGKIFLHETTESLDVVHLETDPWNRQKKLEIFRREFLGNDKAALQCRIKNEEVIKLRYIPSTQTLVAYADAPLKILNRSLGYEVTYNLTEFKAEFSTSGGLRLTSMVYYEGFSLFEDLRKKPSKRHIKNREAAFKGSSLHFMRSLASQELMENGFRIFHKGFEVPPYGHFKIKDHGELSEIEILQQKLIVVYEPLVQSAIQAEGKFFIDVYGNYTPPQKVFFSGEMSKARTANLLPLNYNF